MSNIMAAIGIEQLKRSTTFAKKRKKLAMQYDLLFSDNPVVKPVPRDYDEVVPHIYVVRINGKENRQEIQTNMLEKGIEVGYTINLITG